MSKELEALEEVNNLIEYYGEESTTYDSWQVIIEALTPPTTDEVCEALSEYLKAKVNYIPHKIKKNGFYLVDSGIYLISLGYDNQVNFSYNDWIKFNRLPTHLVTLIGRFYEAQQ